MYVPGPDAPSRTPQVSCTPDGLVLGLKIDDGQLFERLLEEVTLPLGAGDLFVLYTDGVSEAMNVGGRRFGDERLAALVERARRSAVRGAARAHPARNPRLRRQPPPARRHDDGAAEA